MLDGVPLGSSRVRIEALLAMCCNPQEGATCSSILRVLRFCNFEECFHMAETESFIETNRCRILHCDFEMHCLAADFLEALKRFHQ